MVDLVLSLYVFVELLFMYTDWAILVRE
jgi:hypothetical protein